MGIQINGVNGLSSTAQAPAAPPLKTEAARPAVPAETERPAPTAEKQGKDDENEMRSVEEAVGKLNDLTLIFDKSVKFSVTNKLGNVRVQIIDKASDTVIREYPPETAVDLLNRIRDELGVLVDEKV